MIQENKLLQYDNFYRSSGYNLLCGIDEVGRGPLAGPVVAAAVILPADLIIDELNDSKKLTERKRAGLFTIIKEKAIAYSIAEISNEEIDRINILQATFKAMGNAVFSLDITPDYILVDGRDFPTFHNKTDNKRLNGEAIIKGDGKSASIAAASIIAKVYRDNLMINYAKEYPEYGFERHKGYGTKAHREAIKKYGSCPIHRKTFLKNILS